MGSSFWCGNLLLHKLGDFPSEWPEYQKMVFGLFHLGTRHQMTKLLVPRSLKTAKRVQIWKSRFEIQLKIKLILK